MRNKRDDILHGEGIWGGEWLITNDTDKASGDKYKV